MIRFYAIAIPAYLLVLYAVTVLFYHACCLLGTPPPEEMVTVRDKHSVCPALSAGPGTSASPPRRRHIIIQWF